MRCAAKSVFGEEDDLSTVARWRSDTGKWQVPFASSCGGGPAQEDYHQHQHRFAFRELGLVKLAGLYLSELGGTTGPQLESIVGAK